MARQSATVRVDFSDVTAYEAKHRDLPRDVVVSRAARAALDQLVPRFACDEAWESKLTLRDVFGYTISFEWTEPPAWIHSDSRYAPPLTVSKLFAVKENLERIFGKDNL